ncbi:site-2 protease family protein [Methanocaldococcus indicus]|uniref:site-2 protease family protein n=1 Tax=Methanocaldococcus indicus TaxID=213231 RepID=UPI003C6DA538
MDLFDFSPREIKDLVVSVLVITLIFSYPNLSIFNILVGLFAVGLGFVCHELMHRFVARKYNAYSEFVAWYEGLLIALILKLILGFTFIAPGAVYIYKDYLTVEEEGIISLAGPLTNIALAIGFIILAKIIPVLINIGIYGALINIWLAGFNMLPIPPFDGSKVLRWNPLIWAVVAIPLFIFMVFPGLLFRFIF